MTTASVRAITISEVKELENPALIRYIQERGIEPEIARLYCKEVHYRMNGKPFYAIGFRNDAGGWELRNQWYKNSSSPKNITTFDNGSDTAMVFEGFSDLLSYLTLKNNSKPTIDTAVLNSVANLSKAMPFLKRHSVVHSFLDNDPAGRTAFGEMKRNLTGCEVIDQSHFYRHHKDVNEYLRTRQKPKVNQHPAVRRGAKLRR